MLRTRMEQKLLLSLSYLALVAPYQSNPRVAVIGGGISGLVVGHVLQQSGNYSVELFEASDTVGGNVRSMGDPRDFNNCLNIGHATHMGMFWNLRLLLRYLNEPEWPVGRGSNEEPGLFRMLSVMTKGKIYQPTIDDILSPLIWWEAFIFYFCSHLDPEQRLDAFLERRNFSKRFLDILCWAMATFEFDKEWDEIGEYALGTARALLITQVFFKFLLCNIFEGVLPPKLNQGLQDDLLERVRDSSPENMIDSICSAALKLGKTPLASYFTANYSRAMNKLAAGAGNVRTGSTVSHVVIDEEMLLVKTKDGNNVSVDAVVFTIQPSIMVDILNEVDFSEHVSALRQVESGAVGVEIIHADQLPFIYPPVKEQDEDIPFFESKDQTPILGIFDITQLTTNKAGNPLENKDMNAGWLSIAYPVYQEEARNAHRQWLRQFSHADATIYPWTRATASFAKARSRLVELQGLKSVYITGHTLTGVNKASELQVTNALKVCYDYFDAVPLWKDFFLAPLLPDCNDEDAFHKAKSPFEAFQLAVKNLIGSFLLVGVVSKVGADIFD